MVRLLPLRCGGRAGLRSAVLSLRQRHPQPAPCLRHIRRPLPDPAAPRWGWRIGFLASIVLVGIGLRIRRSLNESPLFERAVRRSPARMPLLEVLRQYPSATLVAALATVGSTALGYTAMTFILSYGPARA